jgi:hypothetical protein
MATFCRQQRWLQWPTLRILTHGTKRKRIEVRTRDTMGYLRDGGPVPVVCSEPRTRPEGRRQYCACHDLRGPARQSMLGYRLRWAMAVLHKTGKQSLGFEEVATSGCDAVMSHVHGVSCAYMVRSMSPPGVTAGVTRLGDAPRQLQQLLAHQEKRRILQKLTQIGGVQRYQDALRQALAAA